MTRKISRRIWTVTVVAAIATLACTSPPVTAAAAAPGSATPTAEQPYQPWDPQPQAPVFTLPDTGEKVTAFSGIPAGIPAGAKAAEPGIGYSTARPALDPEAAGRQEVQPEDVPEPVPWLCRTHVTWTPAIRVETNNPAVDPPPNTTQFARIDYRAEVLCNFIFNFALGTAGLVDRSDGFDDRRLQFGSSFNVTLGNYGVSSGSLEIPGERYDGGRQLEIIFDLTVGAPAIWTACEAGPGRRKLRCDGVGSTVLHLVEGTYPFDSGLAAPVIRYVSLGDSFSGGTGADPQMSDGTGCRRSSASYPFLFNGLRAPIPGRPWIDQPVHKACDFAYIGDYYTRQTFRNAERAQKNWLNRNATRLVTISMGGNDLGFGNGLAACANPFTTCTGPLVTAAQLASTKVALSSLYRTIQQSIRPDGYVVVVGYPEVLPSRNNLSESNECFNLTGYNQDELVLIDDAWESATTMIRETVESLHHPRIVFVDMQNEFLHHKVCSTNPWTTGEWLSDIIRSFHPNKAGYPVFRDRIAETLRLSY